MAAPARPYVMAGAVLAAAGVVAVTPIAPRPSRLPIRSIETRLIDSEDSILNVPINLFDDIVNIPYNEVQGLDTLADSEFFTGSWWVASSTNLWGVDPGDPTHVAGILSLLVPFPALSGLGEPEESGIGLIGQLDGLLTAELPVSATCGATTCSNIDPVDPVTGITGIDRQIDFGEDLTGLQSFPLIDDWFQVPLSELASGYTFDSADDAGVTDPSGVAYSGFGFLGTTGSDDAMPWDGTTFTLNLAEPFENFYESLLAPPSTSGIDGTGIEIPTLTDVVQALQAVAAGAVVDFDPFIEGSTLCPGGVCDLTSSMTIESLVQDISNLDPGNPIIDEWLTAVADGTANGPTAEDVAASDVDLDQGLFDIPVPTTDPSTAGIDPNDYGATTETPAGDTASTVDLSQLLNSDLSALLGSSTALTDASTLSADLSAVLSQLSTDLSTQLSTDLGTTLSTDLGTTLPNLLLSLF
jgi:hypothetical protein